MKIQVLHSECWNGGAERLMFSLVAALLEQGHQVGLTTSWIDDYWKSQPISKDIPIRLVNCPLPAGDWHFRNLVILFKDLFSQPISSWFGKRKPPWDALLLDYSPSVIPILRFLYGKDLKMIYYCHYPQQLWAPAHRKFLYRFYVFWLWLLEEYCMSFADCVVSNSIFTMDKVQYCMPSIPKYRNLVLYPGGEPACIHANSELKQNGEWIAGNALVKMSQLVQANGKPVIFSINRFWPEKKVELLVEATEIYLNRQKERENLQQIRVVIAGAIASRFSEAEAYYNMLVKLVHTLNLRSHIIFILSPTEAEKEALFELCHTVAYTPPDEHFGIVPVEVLQHRKMCIACNSGGPMETIVDDVTGFRMKHTDPATLADCLENSLTSTTGNNLATSSVETEEIYQKQASKFSFSAFSENVRQMIAKLFA